MPQHGEAHVLHDEPKEIEQRVNHQASQQEEHDIQDAPGALPNSDQEPEERRQEEQSHQSNDQWLNPKRIHDLREPTPIKTPGGE